MSNNPDETEKLNGQSLLKTQAEAKLVHIPPSDGLSSPAELLLHELQVHQIELKVQNEVLRQSQADLEESRDHYLELYDFAPVGYLTLNREEMIDDVNLIGAAMLGMERSKLMHRRFAPFVAPVDRDRWHRHFLSVLKNNNKQSCELALQNGEDSHFYAILDCLPLKKMARNGIRIVLTDITERKQFEIQEQARNTVLRDTLVREVHHRIKNTLQGVAALLRQQAEESPEAGTALIKAIARVRAVAVVHGLQGEANSQIALCDMVRAISRDLQEITPLPLRLETAPHHVPVLLAETERVPIALIVNELLFNAVKHTDTGQADQAIHIQLQGSEHEMCFSIYSVHGQLPQDFDFTEGCGIGTGLTLVKSLLPPAGAYLSIVNANGGVRTELKLTSPVLLHSKAVQGDAPCL